VPAGAKLVVGDTGDASLVARLIKEHAIDAIAHFAAKIVVPESVQDPLGYYLNNVSNARALIEAAGVPLAAPSANRSGRVSPTRAEHVAADLDGRIDWILDAGPTPLGLESTIVACLGGTPRLLRPGAIARERIEAELGLALASELSGGAAEAPIAPGLLKSHYAPRATLRLAASEATSEEAALDFGGALRASPARTRLDLSPDGDLDEAAANLFAYLRALDATGARTIAVAPIPWSGLGAAINDRLRRAAAPRDGLI